MANHKPRWEPGADFLFPSKLAKAGNTSTPNGSAVTELDVAEWPGMNTLGVSMNRVDFAPGGTNPPHIHPRATEIGIVMKETFLIPRGLMHFQFNVGKTEASMVVSFNSQNPGIVFVPLTLFGSNPPIPTPVLTQALRVEAGVVELLKSKFAAGF
uniref:Germin-like protein n=1 Tax=Aegilops tauschii TaxID=37682 RepID=R7WGB5_AEGTA